jgi:hypothetical protein
MASLLVLTACGLPDSGGGKCESDADCSEGVCSQTYYCFEPSDLRSAEIDWTVNGQPPNATSCAPLHLALGFQGDGIDPIVFEPVPCEEGKFSIAKLPRLYTDAYMLGADGAPDGHLADTDGAQTSINVTYSPSSAMPN